jgi:hypothetical protein
VGDSAAGTLDEKAAPSYADAADRVVGQSRGRDAGRILR